MTSSVLLELFRTTVSQALPFPAQGRTAQRHLALFEVARQDVSLAKLAEAHWDALAILTEAGKEAVPGVLYGVWASEIPGRPLTFNDERLSGEKAFCTGFGLVQRALVTVGGEDGRLLDVDARPGACMSGGPIVWHTEAFRATNTGAVRFDNLPVEPGAVVGAPSFYTSRPGFWHGACGPAACWAGAVAGLLDTAEQNKRSDPHTLAHRAAMQANVWATRSLLQAAGGEIDADPLDYRAAQRRALMLRHSVEQLATDTLRRFARAYGPYPISMQAETVRRYQEADLFLRQCHGERDLEALAHLD